MNVEKRSYNSHFSLIPLGDLFEFGSGLSKGAKEFGFGHPFVTFKDVFKNYYLPEDLTQLANTTDAEISKCSVQRGDVFLTRTSETMDELGMSSVALKDYPNATFNGFTKRLRPKAGTALHPEYLVYAFRSPAFRAGVNSMSTMSTRASLNNEMLARLTIPVPDWDTQVSIGKILLDLDRKIELNRRMAATLEEMARALFKSWFVDFDPVRAKAEGRSTGLPPDIDALFPDELVESELGLIPKGWRKGCLRDLTGFQGGYAFKSKDWVEKGTPVVKIGSVKPGLVDLKSVSYVTEDVAMEAARFRLTPGDLLIGMTGYVGEVGLVPKTNKLPLLNQRVGKFVQDKPGTLSIAYLYCLTRDADFKALVESKSHGTAQANVSADGILSVPVIVPSKILRDQFNFFVKPMIDRILEAHAEASALDITRDAILPKLISGEIKVSEMEIFAEGMNL